MTICVCGAQYQPHDPLANVCPTPEEAEGLDSKSAEYVARSEAAAADIATWPAWMQRNLKPPTVPIESHPYAEELSLGGEG